MRYWKIASVRLAKLWSWSRTRGISINFVVPMMTEAAVSSETVVTTSTITWRHNPLKKEVNFNFCENVICQLLLQLYLIVHYTNFVTRMSSAIISGPSTQSGPFKEPRNLWNAITLWLACWKTSTLPLLCLKTTSLSSSEGPNGFTGVCS